MGGNFEILASCVSSEMPPKNCVGVPKKPKKVERVSSSKLSLSPSKFGAA